MAFTPGDYVHVASFGKGIVREVRNGGRYLVFVKGQSMVVSETALTAIEVQDRGHRRRDSPVSGGIPPELARANARTSIDLHGMTTDEAVAALDELVNDALLAGLTEVQVIHGRTGGRLRAAVHRRLKLLTPVRGFRINPANPGVTIVSLG